MTRQCRATSRAGKQCGRAAIWGAAVCYYHGGRAPQVRRKAAMRLKTAASNGIQNAQHCATVCKVVDMWAADMPMSTMVSWFNTPEGDLRELLSLLALQVHESAGWYERPLADGHDSD